MARFKQTPNARKSTCAPPVKALVKKFGDKVMQVPMCYTSVSLSVMIRLVIRQGTTRYPSIISAE